MKRLQRLFENYAQRHVGARCTPLGCDCPCGYCVHSSQHTNPRVAELRAAIQNYRVTPLDTRAIQRIEYSVKQELGEAHLVVKVETGGCDYNWESQITPWQARSLADALTKTADSLDRG